MFKIFIVRLRLRAFVSIFNFETIGLYFKKSYETDALGEYRPATFS